MTTTPGPPSGQNPGDPWRPGSGQGGAGGPGAGDAGRSGYPSYPNQGPGPYPNQGPGYGWGPGQSGPPYGGPGPVERRNGLGVAALVLGVLAIPSAWTVLGGIAFGIAAIVCGVLGRRLVSRRQATNGGMALAGIITGAVGIVLSGLLIAAGVALFTSDEGRTYRQCVEDANGNQAALDECARTFEDQLRDGNG